MSDIVVLAVGTFIIIAICGGIYLRLHLDLNNPVHGLALLVLFLVMFQLFSLVAVSIRSSKNQERQFCIAQHTGAAFGGLANALKGIPATDSRNDKLDHAIAQAGELERVSEVC